MLGNKDAQIDAEMDNLMFRIRKIDKQMPSLDENGGGGRKNELKGDEFINLKVTFVDRLFKLKKDIQSLQENSQGTKTAEKIQKQSKIRQELKDLNSLINELEAVLNKQINRRRKKLSDEDRKERSALVTQLKGELQQIKTLALKGYVGGNISDIGSRSAADYGIQLNEILSAQGGVSNLGATATGTAGNFGTGAYGGREDLSQEQVQRLAQIEQRDQEHDQILDQIGDVVVDLKDLAQEIGTEAEKQNIMLNGLESRIDDVTMKLDTVNLSMKKQLESKGLGGERFCVNMICCVILLGIVGVIVNAFT